MLSNIGKKIQWLSLILAGVSLVTFLVFGIVFLAKASPDHVNEALRTAGIQAAIICFVSAVLTAIFLQSVPTVLSSVLTPASIVYPSMTNFNPS